MKNLRLPLLGACLFGLYATPASGALAIYEPFDYGAGNFDGTQGGATGTTGFWSQSGGSGLFSRQAGLSFTGLSVTGGSARRTSAPGGSEINIGVSAGAQSTLLNDNTTIYFTLLVRNERFSVGNEGMTMVLGSAAFDVIVSTAHLVTFLLRTVLLIIFIVISLSTAIISCNQPCQTIVNPHQPLSIHLRF